MKGREKFDLVEVVGVRLEAVRLYFYFISKGREIACKDRESRY